MEKLLRERHELHRNLGACTSFSRQQHDSEDTQSLQILLKQRDIVEEELEKEKQSQNELQKEVDRVLFLISSHAAEIFGHTNHRLCHVSLKLVDLKHRVEAGRAESGQYQ